MDKISYAASIVVGLAVVIIFVACALVALAVIAAASVAIAIVNGIVTAWNGGGSG